MSEHKIILTTRDGQQLSFNCAEASDLVTAGEQAGFTLPSICRGGCCGACFGHCQDGDYAMSSVNASVLSNEQIANRDVLLCKTYPKSDLFISAPFDYVDIKFGKQLKRPAVITELSYIAERTVRLKLRWQDTEAGAAVEFESGQYVTLSIPSIDISRAYSLANTSNWLGELVFLIRLQTHGQFSHYLTETAKLGDVLLVDQAKGQFVFHAERLNPVIFIAGGTGVAPFLSMLTRMAELAENRDVLLLMGVNNEAELFAQQELLQLQTALPSLTVQYCVWHPSDLWQGFVGTPADALAAYLQSFTTDCDIYLCGPPLLVDAVTTVAKNNGVSEGRIFFETFF